MGYTEDTSYAGTYNIIYSVTLDNYDPASTVMLAVPFVITVVDPCLPPTSISLDAALMSPIASQVYTVG